MKKVIGILVVALSLVSCSVEPIEPTKQNIEDYQKPKYVSCSVESNLTENEATLYLIDWSEKKPDTILTTTENKVNIQLIERRLYEVDIKNKNGGTKDKFNEVTVKMKTDTIFHLKTENYSSGCGGEFFARLTQ